MSISQYQAFVCGRKPLAFSLLWMVRTLTRRPWTTLVDDVAGRNRSHKWRRRMNLLSAGDVTFGRPDRGRSFVEPVIWKCLRRRWMAKRLQPKVLGTVVTFMFAWSIPIARSLNSCESRGILLSLQVNSGELSICHRFVLLITIKLSHYRWR